LEYAPIPMYEMSGTGLVTLWNAEMANLFGISAEEAIGKPVISVVPSAISTAEMHRVQQELTTSNKSTWFGTHERPNGPPIQCRWTCVRMQDDQGKTLGIAVTGANLTETLKREQELQDSLDLIKAQRDELRALSTPILEVWENVLALPIIGTVDETRATNMMQDLLTAISTRNCQFAILDLTGVAHIDESSATHLVSILKAIALLGARGIVTGLRPATARTMVESGIDFSSVATLPSLRAGLRYCFDELRGSKRPKSKTQPRSSSGAS
jgi:rsbT co-antagonist protein RsbR